MHQFIWNLSSFVYRKLGPKNSWRLAMNPISKFFISLIIKAFGGKKIIVKTKYGFFIQISIDEFLTGGYLHIGEINPFETKILRTILQDNDIFFDVGAYIGWYSLNASQKVGKKGKVFAFEPNPSVAKLLEANCRRNKFNNIIIQKVALSDSNGYQDFWMGGEDMLGSLKKENTSRFSKKIKSIRVKINTLDTFFKERKIKKIRLIKIDAEGSDLQVIKGARSILKKFSPYLIIEVFGLTQETDKKRDEEIISYLSRFGYKPYELTLDGLRLYRGKQKPQLINMFFARDKKELQKLKLL